MPQARVARVVPEEGDADAIAIEIDGPDEVTDEAFEARAHSLWRQGGTPFGSRLVDFALRGPVGVTIPPDDTLITMEMGERWNYDWMDGSPL